VIRRKRREMAISNAELAAMTKSMDELHHDQSMPQLDAAVTEWQDTIREQQRGSTSRRNFLVGTGGIVLAGGLLAACGSSSTGSSTATTTKPTTGPSSSPSSTSGSGRSALSDSDAGSMAVDASIENLAIYAYTHAIAAATAGKLGTIPPAVPVFAETALAHHKAHLAAFNAVLTTANLKAVTVPEPALTPTVLKDFAKVTDVTGVAELAVLLENVAAQSYQDDAATVTNTHARATSASIMPVEMTHAAILYFVLGKYPGTQTTAGTPLAFNPTTLSRPNSDVPKASY
jgi:hypothetical protein